jgi:hypothetical protein
MASLGYTFDATQVDISDSFEPIPPGEYTVEVVESDVRPTKAGTGELIALTLRICDGEFENRRIWTNINHRNSNPKAQAIGEKQLAQLQHAVGLTHGLEDTLDLHNVPVRAVVLVEEGSNGYGPRNSVKAFKAIESATAPVAAARVAQPAAKPSAPWKR